MDFFIFLLHFFNHRMRLAFYRRDSNWPYDVLFPKWSKWTFKIHQSSDQQDLQLSLFGKTLCSILGLRWGLGRSTIRRSESWLGAYNWLGNKSVANIGKNRKRTAAELQLYSGGRNLNEPRLSTVLMLLWVLLLYSNRETSENKTIHTPLPSPPFKVVFYR